jgi:O-antigen ligase
MEMVRLHPFTGVGYGYESFERYAQGHYGDILATMSGLSHAHNTYLETAAESGILAAILLLGFTITRIIALMLQTFRVRKMRHPVGVAMVAWVGLEVALQVYGLSNYALRRNMGILTYGVWGISATMILYAASLTGREPSTPPNEINAEESIATPR